MTPIEKLKEAHLDQWKEADICNMTLAQQCFLDLAPELIALWEAAQGEGGIQNGMEWMADVDKATYLLNAKAAEVLK